MLRLAFLSALTLLAFASCKSVRTVYDENGLIDGEKSKVHTLEQTSGEVKRDKTAFEKQPQVLIDTIIGGAKKVVVAEAGISQGWEGFATSKKDLFNINRFGTSAPANIAAKGLGFTADNLLNVIEG